MAAFSNSTPVPALDSGTTSGAFPTRRSVFIGAAVAAAVPTTSLTQPALASVVQVESTELLAIGAELDSLKHRHAAAVGRLYQAEASALRLCPPVPDSMKPKLNDPLFQGSVRAELEVEVDALGDPVGPFRISSGRHETIGTVASSNALREIISGSYRPEETAAQLTPHMTRALAYEAQREAALAASGLPAARQELTAAALAIWALVHRSKAVEARTAAGLLIKARVLLDAASTWDEHEGPHGRLVAAAGSEDLIASVVQVLGEAV